MSRLAVLLVALSLLAACGADGAPEPPAGAVPGLSVDGKVKVGAVVR
jgi:hypothetical protein